MAVPRLASLSPQLRKGQTEGNAPEMSSCESYPGLLPADPFNSRHHVKMPVAAQQRQRMLAAKRRNPDVIGRNGLAFLFQFQGDLCVVMRGRLVGIQYQAVL